ncbi:MAG TPA: TonB-dependent receptor [Flavobacteriaceae bacterium]|nr:TonB-dependent receptor [Flavobacteriaceae bacterium]HIN99897.1 TonB-dependent receptor [Flavobacteriaceae bacterium]
MRKLIYIILLVPMITLAQQKVEGIVLEVVNNKEVPLPGANVFWLNADVGDVTDFNGLFELPYESQYSKLVISYVGYKSDTLTISEARNIRHVLKSKGALDEVTISARKKATSRSYLEAQNMVNVSSAELLKAACCNLAESFETNPSIDVNFPDAITGTRQIKMLGLKSPNILITTENIPSVRGAAQAQGLSFIPGTWVESIQISKGAGSVVNGFESIAGQINAELQKPTTDHQLFVNAYGAVDGRFELNTHLNTKVSDRWHTGLYLHGNTRTLKSDNNDDGFLDLPLAKQVNVMNRWQYTDGENGFVSFINVRAMRDEKQTGQLDFDPDRDKLTTNFWGSEINTERYDVSAKLGWVNPEIPYQSIGVQTAFSYHNQESYFGLRVYNIEHQSFYGNAMYNSIISDSRHKVKMGVSFTYDQYKELVLTAPFNRKENSVGGFFEYNYDDLENLNLSMGIRADNHNRLGFFVTPRLHARYTAWDKGVFRFSVGSGRRSANIFIENQQLFSSNRVIQLPDSQGPIYGLDPEKAWNYGVSYLQGFNLFGRTGDIALDFYRTDFENQVIVDWGASRQVQFYNLDGDSFANSFQAEVSLNVFERTDLRVAYKYFDVQATMNGGAVDRGTIERALVPKNRIFANVAWESHRTDSGSQWKVDATYNWLDSQRYPFTDMSPEAFQLPERTPTLGTLNFQVTRVFSPRFEVYLGGENVTNVQQENPIVSADDPFGLYFDSTFVYGPIFGSSFYTGLRYNLN